MALFFGVVMVEVQLKQIIYQLKWLEVCSKKKMNR